jgi:imidazolonepropionase-like amidohydrolase
VKLALHGLALGAALLAAPLANSSATAQHSAPTPGAAAPLQRGLLALRAGTIHLVDEGAVIQNGTVLVRGGRILAVGTQVQIPPDALVIDYGADAVLTPGFVLADSGLAQGTPSARTAEPGLLATDNFDFYARCEQPLSGGVTTAYITPSRVRLIAGQGAVVKLAGGDSPERVLRAPAAVHGAINGESRAAPGYWEPPVPATSDTGLGVAQRQLPRTLGGALVALRELIEAARQGVVAEDFGPRAAADLAPLLSKRLTWRLAATEQPEIRAAIALAAEYGFPLVIDDAQDAGPLAAEIAKSGAGVVYRSPFHPERSFQDRGAGPDARWPEYDVPSKLVAAGVRLAIAPSTSTNPRDLRFAAALARRGGLDEAAALRAITLGAAEILGVSARVGSIAPGKDADFAVLNGPPLDPTSSVLATWVQGELAWTPAVSSASPTPAGPVVVQVAELHVGDGRVLRPGELLLSGGKIVEIGERVGRPRGAQLVRGAAAMPGIVDAFGHLGLEDSTRLPATDFKLARIVAPGDPLDRRVARSGVTTVVMSPRGSSPTGAPVLAYKPAASTLDGLVLRDPVALRMRWSERNRAKSGEAVKAALDKAVKYQEKWLEYEKALAAWKPDPNASEETEEDADAAEPKKEDATEGGDKDKDAKDEGEDKSSDKDAKKPDAKDAKDSKEGAKESGKDSKDKKSRAKKDGDKGKDEAEPLPADPFTGVWTSELAVPPRAEPSAARLQLIEEHGELRGSLRCDALSSELVLLTGTRKEAHVSLSGAADRGLVLIEGDWRSGKLECVIGQGSWQSKASFEQTSKEYPRAQRSEQRKPKTEEAKPAPSAKSGGKPQPPRIDERLEPLRQAMLGQGALIVEVERADEILACVDACAAAGIKPVLLGAEDAWKVAERLRGRVAGVLLSPQVLRYEPQLGTNVANRYAELQTAGIPVAFHSSAEDGAADLLLRALFAVSQGMSPTGALRALTSDAAAMLGLGSRVGRLEVGLDADVLVLDSSPLDSTPQVVRAFVNGAEVLP